MRLFFAALWFLTAIATAHAAENEHALISGDRAYLLRSPRVVATGYIGNKAVSPDGGSLLFDAR